jgi:hypothetical protein
VYTSTSPPFRAATWSSSLSSIDPVPIHQLACPSSIACIAIDSLGRVLTAAAPFSGPNWSAPSSLSIDAANTIQQLVCATSWLCIAADGNGNVLTSTTPPFSASTWSTSAVDPFRTITGLACSSNVFCVIGDEAGNVLAGTLTLPVSTAAPMISGAAIGGQTLTASHGSWTNSPTGYSDQWQDCDTAGNACSAIAGATGLSYTLKASDAGHTIRLLETASNSAGAGQPVSSAQTAVVTPAPTNASPPPGSACSNVTGLVAASAAKIKAGLRRQIAPTGAAARIAALRKHRRYLLTFSSICAGKLAVSWTYVPKRHGTSKAKPVTVATGTASFSKPQKRKLTIKLTSRGVKLLHRSTLSLVARGSFTPTGNPAVVATKAFTLR